MGAAVATAGCPTPQVKIITFHCKGLASYGHGLTEESKLTLTEENCTPIFCPFFYSSILPMIREVTPIKNILF